jgi:hypothetical protein
VIIRAGSEWMRRIFVTSLDGAAVCVLEVFTIPSASHSRGEGMTT